MTRKACVVGEYVAGFVMGISGMAAVILLCAALFTQKIFLYNIATACIIVLGLSTALALVTNKCNKRDEAAKRSSPGRSSVVHVSSETRRSRDEF